MSSGRQASRTMELWKPENVANVKGSQCLEQKQTKRGVDNTLKMLQVHWQWKDSFVGASSMLVTHLTSNTEYLN